MSQKSKSFNFATKALQMFVCTKHAEWGSEE